MLLEQNLTISCLSFFNQYNQIKNQEIELVRKHDQAIMNGSDMNVVIAKLQARSEQLAREEDQLVTSFVTDNFDNVLGPGVFFMLTIGQEYPELTPWLEDIMSKATDRFKGECLCKRLLSEGKRQPANYERNERCECICRHNVCS